eukprot:1102728-Prorocentrum_minimum.AAC.4
MGYLEEHLGGEGDVCGLEAAGGSVSGGGGERLAVLHAHAQHLHGEVALLVPRLLRRHHERVGAHHGALGEHAQHVLNHGGVRGARLRPGGAHQRQHRLGGEGGANLAAHHHARVPAKARHRPIERVRGDRYRRRPHHPVLVLLVAEGLLAELQQPADAAVAGEHGRGGRPAEAPVLPRVELRGGGFAYYQEGVG